MTNEAILYLTLATAGLGFLTSAVNFWRGIQRDKAIQGIHISLNSELKELKTLIAKDSRAEGVIEGRADEKANPTN